MKELLRIITTWWGITIISVLAVILWILLSSLLYRQFFKRFYDIILSCLAIVICLPLLMALSIIGGIMMRGNPFFVQQRPGMINAKTGKERLFLLIKFKTMTDERDNLGALLPDSRRLTKYGKFLRSTSMDELPELLCIFIGTMSIVGPRPLLVQYLPLYNEDQRHRHDVRPGLTGLAQVSGRNAISWEEKFRLDLEYVKNISLWHDMKILFKTVGKVFKRSGISQEGNATMDYFTGDNNHIINILILSAGRRVELINCLKNARDKLKIKGNVFAADIDFTAPALYFADDHFIIPKIDAENYIESLIDLCNKNNISLIIPTIDTELEMLAKNKVFIESQTKSRVLVSDHESITTCCSKYKTIQHFKEYNFGYTKLISQEDIRNSDAIFPLLIKPENGSSSKNVFKVNNKSELEFFMNYIDNPILQEYVLGCEYTVDCFSDFNGNIISIVPRIRLATRSGEILKGKIDKNKVIINDVQKLLRSFDFIGPITIQCFLCDDGSIKYIEINPRFGGGAPMSIMAGADSCENLYRLLCGETLKYNENYEDDVIFSRFDSSIRVTYEC